MITALERFRVIDLSETVAGQFCCRLMADYGASVTLIEPAEGSALRCQAPMAMSGDSLVFRHLNHGKILHRLRSGATSSELAELAAEADLAVVPAGFDADAIRSVNGDCVIVEVSDFGTDGPYKDWQGGEMIVQALSGMMNNNGEAGRPPLFGTGQRAAYAAGLAAYISAIALLLARDKGGATRHASVDVAETAAAMSFPYVLQHAYNGTDRRRGDQEIPAGQVLCRGTWVCIWVYPFRFSAMCRTLGLECLIDDPRFAEPVTRTRNWAALFDEIQEALVDRDAEEVVRHLQDAQVIAACAYRSSELAQNPHLEARGFWETVRMEGAEVQVLGRPFRMSRAPQQLATEDEPGARKVAG
ncbi:CoA transferase [Paracoccus tibetensis]|uniref:Crotonobetainyl-CoA:carnitine CoA-transferase CaiB n=1 Tax=Paracoccus tibetensis TaxID=336292 RepID=A0A1G5FVC0_9RHOB|nr:CoA transferase [Paracoccus tibetensis]SCY43111.1 Crotonobetainyl-CoA:carnitine CoA-transferase CaiB [Paracoccus tibetensis]